MTRPLPLSRRTRYPALPVEAGYAGLLYPLSGIAHITGRRTPRRTRSGLSDRGDSPGLFVPWSPGRPQIDVEAEEREVVGIMLDAAFGAAIAGAEDDERTMI